MTDEGNVLNEDATSLDQISEQLIEDNKALRWFVQEYESVLRAIGRLDIIDGVNADYLK